MTADRSSRGYRLALPALGGWAGTGPVGLGIAGIGPAAAAGCYMQNPERSRQKDPEWVGIVVGAAAGFGRSSCLGVVVAGVADRVRGWGFPQGMGAVLPLGMGAALAGDMGIAAAAAVVGDIVEEERCRRIRSLT